MRSPYPYFGAKHAVAPVVWERLGEVANYVEPFLGGASMILARPGGAQGVECVNDACGYVCNFWRALQADPEAVAYWCDQPIMENDLHARHVWLRARDMRAQLEGDPEWYDAKAAGWWVWGASCWIGSGWCGPQGDGPWLVVDGRFERVGGRGVTRQIPNMAGGQGVTRQIPNMAGGQGVTRQIPNMAGGQGVTQYMLDLAARMRSVKVVCGDWSRVCGPLVTWRQGLTGVFLDPPYSEDRCDVYSQDSVDVWRDVQAWCVENGERDDMRIALAGYSGEHEALESRGWSVYAWKASGGYANQGNARGRENVKRERIWFSPACIKPQRQEQAMLW